jgi:hypothetical protein
MNIFKQSFINEHFFHKDRTFSFIIEQRWCSRLKKQCSAFTRKMFLIYKNNIPDLREKVIDLSDWNYNIRKNKKQKCKYIEFYNK